MSKQHLGDGMTIQWRLNDWFKDLGNRQLNQLKFYHEELLKANKTLSLVGVKTISQLDLIHFADSILASQQVSKITGKNEVYDLGSGNGFPGLVMAILAPTTQVILVDMDTKKCEFLKNLSSQLNLTNVKVMNTQVEKLPDNSVQFAICRGFASISKTVLMLRKPIKKGGIVFHMKSEEWFKEVSEIPTQLCSYWRPSLLAEYRLPVGEVTFAVVRTEKFSD